MKPVPVSLPMLVGSLAPTIETYAKAGGILLDPASR
jgi:hypothetical protein